MRLSKLFFIAAALVLSTSAFAYPTYGIDNNSGPKELKQLLSDCQLSIKDDIKVIVLFTLSDRHEIQVYSIKSENEEVNQFLKSRLENQKLDGKNWYAGKLYEVPIKIKAKE